MNKHPDLSNFKPLPARRTVYRFGAVNKTGLALQVYHWKSGDSYTLKILLTPELLGKLNWSLGDCLTLSYSIGTKEILLTPGSDYRLTSKNKDQTATISYSLYHGEHGNPAPMEGRPRTPISNFTILTTPEGRALLIDLKELLSCPPISK